MMLLEGTLGSPIISYILNAMQFQTWYFPSSMNLRFRSWMLSSQIVKRVVLGYWLNFCSTLSTEGVELSWNFLFPCFRFRYYSRSRIYYKEQYRGKWGPKNVANPCGFTFIGTHVLVLPCISMEDEQTTVKQNIAKIVQTFKLQIFHRKRNTENKRALTKILVFCLVFSGAGSLFKIFLFYFNAFLRP